MHHFKVIKHFVFKIGKAPFLTLQNRCFSSYLTSLIVVFSQLVYIFSPIIFAVAARFSGVSSPGVQLSTSSSSSHLGIT